MNNDKKRLKDLILHLKEMSIRFLEITSEISDRQKENREIEQRTEHA